MPLSPGSKNSAMRCCAALDVAAGEPGTESSDPNYRDMVLDRRLCQALVHLNRDLPPVALRDTLLPMRVSGELRVRFVKRTPKAGV